MNGRFIDSKSPGSNFSIFLILKVLFDIQRIFPLLVPVASLSALAIRDSCFASSSSSVPPIFAGAPLLSEGCELRDLLRCARDRRLRLRSLLALKNCIFFAAQKSARRRLRRCRGQRRAQTRAQASRGRTANLSGPVLDCIETDFCK